MDAKKDAVKWKEKAADAKKTAPKKAPSPAPTPVKKEVKVVKDPASKLKEAAAKSKSIAIVKKAKDAAANQAAKQKTKLA